MRDILFSVIVYYKISLLGGETGTFAIIFSPRPNALSQIYPCANMTEFSKSCDFFVFLRLGEDHTALDEQKRNKYSKIKIFLELV